jgi:hypothetical protein
MEAHRCSVCSMISLFLKTVKDDSIRQNNSIRAGSTLPMDGACSSGDEPNPTMAAACSYHLDRARWSAAPGSLGVARHRAAIRGPRGRTHRRHRCWSGGTHVEGRDTLPTSKRLAPRPVMRRIGIDEGACGLAGLPPVSGCARRWRWLRRGANGLTHRSMLERKTVTSHKRRKSRLCRNQH